jgi:hypothetical protein
MGFSESALNTHDFTTIESKNIVPPASIKQKIQFKAHNDRINYVSLIN